MNAYAIQIDVIRILNIQSFSLTYTIGDKFTPCTQLTSTAVHEMTNLAMQ